MDQKETREDTLESLGSDSSKKSLENKPNLLFTSSFLPQRTYLSNRTGQYLSRKQKEFENRFKRKDVLEEDLMGIKKLRVDKN